MSIKQKILIVGGNGFIGSSLTRAFVNNYQVFSTYHRSYTPVKDAYYLPLPQLSEKDRCDRFINSIEPDVVIYCLGSNSDIEAEKEPKAAQSVHSNGITHLMHSAEMSKAKFIYISSNYVFSGIEGNFSESDSTVPSSQLGKAKTGAESLLKSRSLNHLIIRCAPIMGRGTLDHPSWMDRIREKIIHDKKVVMSSRQIHNPVHISYLVEVIERAIEKDLKNKVIHVAGLTKISYFEFAKQFIKNIGLSAEMVETNDINAMASPIDYSLNFSESLTLLQTQPLLLEQSFNLLK